MVSRCERRRRVRNRKPVNYFNPTTKISPKQNFLSKSPQILHPESPHPNGNGSSREMQLTSIKSSCCSIMLSLIKREWVAWETWKLYLEPLKAKNESLWCHIPYNLAIIHSHSTPTSNIISDTPSTFLIIDLSSWQSILHTPCYHTTVSMPHYYPDTSDPCTHFLPVSLFSTPHSFLINPMCFSLVT